MLPRPRLGDPRGRERIRPGTAGPGGGAGCEAGPNGSGDARRNVPSAASFVAELATQSGDEDFAVVIADVDDIDETHSKRSRRYWPRA